jgi:hypothetical protein
VLSCTGLLMSQTLKIFMLGGIRCAWQGTKGGYGLWVEG